MHYFVLRFRSHKLTEHNAFGIFLAKLTVAKPLNTGLNISMALKTVNLTSLAPKYCNDALNQLIEAALTETTLYCLQSNSYKLAETLANLECEEAIIETAHPIFPFLKNELKNFHIQPIAV